MKFRSLTFLLAVSLCVGGCPDSTNKTAQGKKKKPDTTKNQSNDVTFQGFVGQLRIAVQRRDKSMLSQMMAEDFGYRWDNPAPDEDAFAYWDKNNLWPELAALMNERWVPHEGYMVVPPQLAMGSGAEYQGYRAGVQQVNGSWKFSYFVSAPPPGH